MAAAKNPSATTGGRPGSFGRGSDSGTAFGSTPGQLTRPARLTRGRRDGGRVLAVAGLTGGTDDFDIKLEQVLNDRLRRADARGLRSCGNAATVSSAPG